MRSAAIVVALILAGCATAHSPEPLGAPAVDARGDAPGAAASAPAGEPAGLFSRDWIFFELDGYDGPLPSPPPIAGFNITREGRRVTGTTACNRLGAGYEIDEHAGRLRFTSLRNTRMMCDRVAADTEEAVLAAMIATDAYELDGDRLVLFSKGRVIARLKTLD
jgi:heat shock protein HslJ